jgi:predicted acyl esterase
MAGRERQGSAHSFEVVVERDVMVAMRDGVRLATEIYRLACGGAPAPAALLSRGPLIGCFVN